MSSPDEPVAGSASPEIKAEPPKTEGGLLANQAESVLGLDEDAAVPATAGWQGDLVGKVTRPVDPVGKVTWPVDPVGKLTWTPPIDGGMDASAAPAKPAAARDAKPAAGTPWALPYPLLMGLLVAVIAIAGVLVLEGGLLDADTVPAGAVASSSDGLAAPTKTPYLPVSSGTPASAPPAVASGGVVVPAPSAPLATSGHVVTPKPGSSPAGPAPTPKPSQPGATPGTANLQIDKVEFGQGCNDPIELFGIVLNNEAGTADADYNVFISKEELGDFWATASDYSGTVLATGFQTVTITPRADLCQQIKSQTAFTLKIVSGSQSWTIRWTLTP